MNQENAIFIISPFATAEKAKEYYLKFSEEFKSMLYGRNQYVNLSVFYRLKFILKYFRSTERQKINHSFDFNDWFLDNVQSIVLYVAKLY